MSLNIALGDAGCIRDAMVKFGACFPRFHVNSVGDEMVLLESAQNCANLSSASARFFFRRISVVMSPPRD